MGTFYYQATDGGVRGSTVIVVLYSVVSAGLMFRALATAEQVDGEKDGGK